MKTSNPDIGVLRRATGLLRALAAGNYLGRALTELSADTGLPHPTVHRLLANLIEEGLVAQHPQTKRYRLGPLLYELGLSAANGYDLGLVLRPVIERVAEQTGDTSYVIMRSGLEAVCVARAEGPHPIKTVTLNIGSRRPLGVGAGGMAIVAACPPDEAQWIAEAVGASIGRFNGLTPLDLLQAVSDARERGYATVRNQVQLGVTGVGMAFCDSVGRPLGAVSVGSVSERLPPERHGAVGEVLAQAVAEIELGLRAMPLRG